MNTCGLLLQLLGSCLLLGVYSQEIGLVYRNVTQILQLNNGLSWGLWGEMDFCEEESFVHAFELKYDPPGGVDNTAVNGVKLYCRTRDLYDDGYVTSVVGTNGVWQGMQSCHHGFLTGMRAEVLEPQGALHDDVAVDDTEMQCDNGEVLYGLNYNESMVYGGTWSDWAHCNAGTQICGLQTRYEDFSVGDDTGINDIVMFCCKY